MQVLSCHLNFVSAWTFVWWCHLFLPSPFPFCFSLVGAAFSFYPSTILTSAYWVSFAPQFPLGTFVHPSGVEQPVNHCIDVMARLHGDKQGTNYRIWVDRVSSAQVGSDTWLVKFYKWESFGEIYFPSSYGSFTCTFLTVHLHVLFFSRFVSALMFWWSCFLLIDKELFDLRF